MPGKKKILLRVLSQLPEATIRVPQQASAPYSYTGFDQRQSGAAPHRRVATSKKGVRRLQAFSSFIMIHRTMVYSYLRASIGLMRDAFIAG